MFSTDGTKRSLLEELEGESERLKSLANITEEERATRRKIIEGGFVEVSYCLFTEAAGSDTLRDMGSLTNFVRPADQGTE